jgi:hypothetical protein
MSPGNASRESLRLLKLHFLNGTQIQAGVEGLPDLRRLSQAPEGLIIS